MRFARAFAPLLTVTLVTLQLPFVAGAAPGSAQAVTRVENELNDALMACDANALTKLWAEDMTFIFPNGVAESRKQRLDGLAQCVPGAQRSTVESVAITDLGETVVAIVLSDWSATFNGKPFAAKFRATHVWTRRTGIWLLVAAHVSQLKQ